MPASYGVHEGRDPDRAVDLVIDERRLLYREIRAPGTPDQSTTQFDYDSSGNVTAIRRGLEGDVHTTRFDHDGYEGVVARVNPSGNVLTRVFDPLGVALRVAVRHAAQLLIRPSFWSNDSQRSSFAR